jgi:hypothetical protein
MGKEISALRERTHTSQGGVRSFAVVSRQAKEEVTLRVLSGEYVKRICQTVH